jgi:diaminohydroxyphosphoribosylaminopyrimidine deaminase / 5-amino-6-(5-phosphoribosylamino)uracil reductase
LDARTAPASGAPLWISGQASREDVQAWRARSSAVLTGSATVRSDDPRLNVRLTYGPWIRQPLRVVLDTNLTCNADRKIFAGDQALIFAAADARSQGPAGVAVERVPRVAGGVDLPAVMQRLAAREVNELLLECGATLGGAFVAAGLVDQLVLYVAPTLLGEDAAPLLRFKELGMGARAGAFPGFAFRDAQRVGADVRLILDAEKT